MIGIETAAAVTIPASAADVAQALAEAVRAATSDLPFGLEPASFLVALDELAADTEESA